MTVKPNRPVGMLPVVPYYPQTDRPVYSHSMREKDFFIFFRTQFYFQSIVWKAKIFFWREYKMKKGGEKIGIQNVIDILTELKNTTMPSELPVEIVMDNSELREIKKIEFFNGSLGIFTQKNKYVGDTLMTFDSDDAGICPIFKRETDISDTQFIRHYQCDSEVEVCIDCKSDFIKINDIFFRGIL